MIGPAAVSPAPGALRLASRRLMRPSPATSRDLALGVVELEGGDADPIEGRGDHRVERRQVLAQRPEIDQEPHQDFGLLPVHARDLVLELGLAELREVHGQIDMRPQPRPPFLADKRRRFLAQDLSLCMFSSPLVLRSRPIGRRGGTGPRSPPRR